MCAVWKAKLCGIAYGKNFDKAVNIEADKNQKLPLTSSKAFPLF